MLCPPRTGLPGGRGADTPSRPSGVSGPRAVAALIGGRDDVPLRGAPVWMRQPPDGDRSCGERPRIGARVRPRRRLTQRVCRIPFPPSPPWWRRQHGEMLLSLRSFGVCLLGSL